MSEVVVVGGGLGGMAAAARLAKLGHVVRLIEASPSLGGALTPYRHGELAWANLPDAVLLPAVLRDLFRKTGRPLETELGEELEPAGVVRTHHFADGSSVALPGGSRADQIAAVDELGAGLGTAWVDHVAGYGPAWDLLRRHYLERPYDADLADPRATAVLRSRESLAARMSALPDERLRLLAGFPAWSGGHDLRRVPAWQGLDVYLEQRFGSWVLPGGAAKLATLLERRLRTRRVEVQCGTPVRDVALPRGGQGDLRVITEEGAEIVTDIVVVAVDPRRLRSLRRLVRGRRPAPPPTVTHLLVDGDLSPVSGPTVWHGHRGRGTVVGFIGGEAPDGATPVTLWQHGSGDALETLARIGPDLRSRVRVRVDRTPTEVALPGSPCGLRWQGAGTGAGRPGPGTPWPGVFLVGAHGTPGPGVPYVGLSAWLAAQLIGPPR